jgi:hypothetical protein
MVGWMNASSLEQKYVWIFIGSFPKLSKFASFGESY